MKKLAVMLLTGAMALSVYGCGGSAQSAAPTEPAKEEAPAEGAKEEAPAEEAKEEAPAEEAAEADAAPEAGVGKYRVVNNTGEAVTEVYMYVNGEAKGDNYVDGTLADGDGIDITFEAAADAELTVEAVTEGGYEIAFNTLHIEEASISLLAADAMTGATQIQFGPLQ